MSIRYSDLHIGSRVELHPATDLWMQGRRFGEVDSLESGYVFVRTERGDPRPVRLEPHQIQRVVQP